MTDPMRPRGPCFHRACGLLVALALSSGVGCFGDDDPVVDPDAGAPVDVGSSNDLGPADASPDVADAADDLGSAVDVPRDAADAATDADAARPCDLDNDCRDPALPRCLVATGRCVRCLPGRGDCGRGQRCDPTTYTCTGACTADTDCHSESPNDAGTSADAAGGEELPLRCDTERGVCIECAQDDECPVRSICAMGLCVPGCSPQRGCSVGEVCCSSTCVVTRTDLSHCGGCGMRCEAANGVTSCDSGRCALVRCNDGFADCNNDLSDGCEADLRRDLQHCGTCNSACPMVTNAGTVACSAGRCGYTCRAGYADCDGDPATGCERFLDEDETNCGRCGRACMARPNADLITCGMGVCGALCNVGYGDCDGDSANGCETNTRTSAAHCGACGSTCPARPNGVPACAAGRCTVRCNPGFGDCDGDPINGCEADLRTTAEHCSACGSRCDLPGGTAACVGGVCSLAACGDNFADCDNNLDNGCESDTRSSTAHCGACGNTCPARANARATCADRACGYLCNEGFGDCDMDPSNGCEVNLRTSTEHCGACGNTCMLPNATAACVMGVCSVSACTTGRGNCDSNAANGCEADLTADLNNCGACGVRGVERCDGMDNDCDGAVDEGCPLSLGGLDVYDFVSPSYGSTSGTAYELACPSGTVVTGFNSYLYSSTSYPVGLQLRCGRPRLVEDRSTTPYRYTVVLDDAGTTAYQGLQSGVARSIVCPANAFAYTVTGRYSSYHYQLGFSCATWTLDGAPTTGWRFTRTPVGSAQVLGLASGTAYSYTGPLEGQSGSAMRALFGTWVTRYFYRNAARFTAPSVTTRP
jgi:hypothetical protein